MGYSPQAVIASDNVLRDLADAVEEAYFDAVTVPSAPKLVGFWKVPRDFGSLLVACSAKGSVAYGFCDTGAAEDFQLVPSESTSTGFRLHAVHSNLCLGVLDVSMADWTPVFQLPCDSSGAGQTFTFEPRA